MDAMVDPNYFDYAASAPPWKEAIEEYTKISEAFYANPSSIHRHGKEAKMKLLELKKELYDLLHFYDGRLLLCASGTEANNTIINGHMDRTPKGKLLIAEDVHDSIWYATGKYPEASEILHIDEHGQYRLEHFEKALSNNITLACINHVCNETGTIHPVKEIAEICDHYNVKLLIDGMQSIGHVLVFLNDIPCSYYTISGHKLGSVRGAAGAFIRDREFNPLIRGGRQEWDLRSGTENIAGLASMVQALKISLQNLDTEFDRLNSLKRYLLDNLSSIPNLLINSPESSVPHLISISLPGSSGREIVGALSMMGFAISTGSACHANQMEPSRIILAMGRSKEEATGSVRISMGSGTTREAVHELVHHLIDLIN